MSTASAARDATSCASRRSSLPNCATDSAFASVRTPSTRSLTTIGSTQIRDEAERAHLLETVGIALCDGDEHLVGHPGTNDGTPVRATNAGSSTSAGLRSSPARPRASCALVGIHMGSIATGISIPSSSTTSTAQ